MSDVRKFVVRMDKQLHDKVKRKAKDRRMSMNSAVLDALEKDLLPQPGEMPVDLIRSLWQQDLSAMEQRVLAALEKRL